MKKWRLVIIILIMAFILLLLPNKYSKILKNYSWQALKPINYIFSITLGRTFPYLDNIFYLNEVVKQNTNLVSENLQLQSRLAELSEMQNENEILKKELGFMQTQDLKTTVAAAIIGEPSGYLKSLVIDKGQGTGIKTGDAVISQGVLIGTIAEVRQNNSDVTLITDYNSLVPVVLQKSRGTGLLRGGLSGLTIEDIPLNIQINKSENVVTSGLGGQVPAGILIGQVADIISKEGEIFQKVTTISPVDFSHLEVVFVIKK